MSVCLRTDLSTLLDATGILLEALRQQLLKQASAGGLGQALLQNHGLPQEILHLHPTTRTSQPRKSLETCTERNVH